MKVIKKTATKMAKDCCLGGGGRVHSFHAAQGGRSLMSSEPMEDSASLVAKAVMRCLGKDSYSSNPLQFFANLPSEIFPKFRKQSSCPECHFSHTVSSTSSRIFGYMSIIIFIYIFIFNHAPIQGLDADRPN